MRTRVLKAGSPLPWINSMGSKEDGDGDLQRVLLVPAVLAPPVDSREGKGTITGTTNTCCTDMPSTPAVHPPFLLSPLR